MAEAPPRLIRIEEEIEAEEEATEDFVFRRLGEPVPLKPSDSQFDLEAPPSRPLAISERFRVLFLAHSEGFLVAKTKDVIELGKDIKEKGKGPCIQNSSVVDVEIGRVSLLALSNDSSVLAAAVGGQIHFFYVPSLLDNKEVKPSFSCSLKNSGMVKDLRWQKNSKKSFVLLSNDGLLCHGRIKDPLKDLLENVDAVDWSREGDFIAVARESNLSILSSEFKEEICISLPCQAWPSDTESENFIKVDSIEWVRDDIIVIGCIKVNEEGNEEGYLVQVITCGKNKFTESSCKLAVFSFPDLFQGSMDDILPNGAGPYLLLSYLDRWELLLASGKKNIDQHVLLLKCTIDDSQREVTLLEFQNDKYKPTIGLQENGDENLILGFGIDKVSLYEKIELEVGEKSKELSPLCVLFCLTCDGKLNMYHVARISDPSDIPQSSLPSTDASLEGELLTISSKDTHDAEGLMSNERTNQIPAEASSAPTGTELRSARNERIPQAIKEHYPPDMGDGSSGNSIIIPSIGQPAMIAPSTSLSPQNGPSPVDVRKSTMATVSSLAEGVDVPLFVGKVSNEVAITSQANGKNIFKGEDMGALPPNVVGFGRVPSKSQSSLFTSGTVASGSREKIAPEVLMTSLSQENLISGSASNLKASGGGPSLFSSNETNSGVRSTMLNKSANLETTTIIPVSSSLQQNSVIGKSSFSQPQSCSANSRTRFSQIDSVLQPAKKLYNGTDMFKELDALLSLIEQEDGFRDACTVYLRSSVSAIEEDLKTLLVKSKICRKSVEEEHMEIQDLKKKMNEVTAKQLYMKDIVSETSNNQYWDIWNRQKLNPEIELKQQHIWKAYQDLTSQLIDLERHFNLVEISKFGGSDTFSARQSAVHCTMRQSRHSQSLHSVYNTINLQLAAAEQLSECLANQMALLNINSSTKRMGVKKELFESIGLADEGITLESPDAESPLKTPDSLKRNSSLDIASKEKSRRLSTSALSCIDPESIRRRRESLEKSCPNFEPPKTIVKRITQKEDARIIVDNPFRTAKKQFDSQIEAFATIQQKASGNSKYVTPSLTREVQPDIYTLNEDIQGMPSQQISKSPASSVFKWAKEPSVVPQSLGSNCHPTEEIKKTPSQSSVTLSPVSSLFPPGSLKAQEPKSYQFENIKKSTTLSSIDMTSSASLFNGVSIVPKESMASVASASNLSAKSVSPPKLMSNMPKEAPKSTILSLNIASGVSPTKSTSKELVQGNKQLNLKALGEGFTSRLNEGIQQSAASPQSSSALSNMSSALSFSTVPSSAPLNLGGQTDSTGIVTSTQQPIGTVTAQTAATNVVSSQPLFSAFALSSPPSLISGASTLTIASLSTMASGGLSSFNATSKGEANIVHSVSPPTSTSAQCPVPTSRSSSQSQTLGSTFGTTQSESTSVLITRPHLDEAKSKSESTVQQSSSRDPSASKIESATSQVAANVSLIGLNVSKEPTVLPTGSSIPTSSNSQTEINSASGPVDEMIATEKSGGLDLNALEEEMEEESSDASNLLNLQSFGGFGLGSASILSPNPKPNPFGGSFVTANASSASFPHTLSASPGQPFRPASFSLPTVQPAHSSSAFSGASTSGFGGFGQPSQIGAGQQALGSALGSFGQTRQLGSGGFTVGFSSVANSGFSSAGAFGGTNSGGGFAALASQGGGFASSSTGGFAAVSSIGGGFAGVASGGFAAAAAASGGAGGFAGAGTAAGFGAVASTTGSFAGAASQSGGFGGAGSGSGFTTGGFGAFSSTQGSAFSAFGGSGATGTGRPSSSELFTQMRR